MRSPLMTCLVALASSPRLTTWRSQPSVYTAPAGPRSRTVTYQGIRSDSIGRTQQVADDVVTGVAAHWPAVLTRHHRQVFVVHPRDRDIARGEDAGDALDPQVVVNWQPAQPVARHTELRGQRVGPHSGAPHHGRRGHDLPGRTDVTLRPRRPR